MLQGLGLSGCPRQRVDSRGWCDSRRGPRVTSESSRKSLVRRSRQMSSVYESMRGRVADVRG
eukprot:11325399-Alexandrium_andersonii.AAC.1